MNLSFAWLAGLVVLGVSTPALAQDPWSTPVPPLEDYVPPPPEPTLSRGPEMGVIMPGQDPNDTVWRAHRRTRNTALSVLGGALMAGGGVAAAVAGQDFHKCPHDWLGFDNAMCVGGDAVILAAGVSSFVAGTVLLIKYASAPDTRPTEPYRPAPRLGIGPRSVSLTLNF